MSYATIEQLVHAATGGWSELAQRASNTPLVDGELLRATATGGDRSSWSPEAQAAADLAHTRILEVLDMATRHADTYLFPRYGTQRPLAEAMVQGSSLPAVVATIALKRLYGTDVPEGIRNGAKWADDYLRDLAKGTVSLGQLDTEVAQPAGRTVARTPEKRFDWGAY